MHRSSYQQSGSAAPRDVQRPDLSERLLPWFMAIGLSLSLIVPAAHGSARDRAQGPKLILIHVDAVAFDLMQKEIDRGNLPNIDHHFHRRGLIRQGLTYFPSKTPFVISSIRDAKSVSEGLVVGWDIPMYQDYESLQMTNTFILMAKSKHRLARSNLMYGLPTFDGLAEPALMNTVEYFDEYRVLEFYWYTIDIYGHQQGKESYLQHLRNFDRVLGRYIERLDCDVNVIIYSDHGMVFGEGVPIYDLVDDLFAEDIEVFSYPLLYLKDAGRKEEIARRMVDETPLDFAFFRVDENWVKGFAQGAELFVHRIEDRYRLICNGRDALGYGDLGYGGEYRSADEWLELTIDHDYPATPVIVSRFLKNPNASEIVVSFDATKFAETLYTRMGNHGGFTAREMVVPVMARGPDVENIKDHRVIWLEELFSEVYEFDFLSEPRRDRHTLRVHSHVSRVEATLGLTLSPVYRYQAGAELTVGRGSVPEKGSVWGAYDMQRSYLSRLWLGAGWQWSADAQDPFFMLKYNTGYGRYDMVGILKTSGNHAFSVGYRLTDSIKLKVTDFNSMGIRLSF